MARRRPRTRAQELEAHAVIGRAAAELCEFLMQVEPQIADFQFARRILIDGVAQLDDARLAEEAQATAPAEPKA